MTTQPILIYPDPFLRTECREVTEITPAVTELLDTMVQTMYDAPGIGLAAPQIGSDLRAIVIDLYGPDNPEHPAELLRLLNPIIVRTEGEMESEEGCLSIPDVRETVKRAAKIWVKAVDEGGKEVEFEATGLLSACFQHEIDHLNGVLFIDRLSRIRRELVKSKLKRLTKG
jgi:peptide deformylase